MIFVDSYNKLQQYKNVIKDKRVTVVPLLLDNRAHFVKNDIIAFYATCEGKEFTFPYKHPESVFKDYMLEDVLSGGMVYVYDSHLLRYLKSSVTVNDLETAHYLSTSMEHESDEISTQYHYRRLYNSFGKQGYIQPLSRFIEYARSIILNTDTQENAGAFFYNTSLFDVFHKIESSGLCVNKEYFIAQYGNVHNLVDNKVYTKYNYFTSTGRPSNRFGGINFAALNKNDDTRKCFISRYDDGKLVEIDFRAYHPHIIAWLCDYDFGNEDVYEHLAKHYNNTDTPTEQQIKEAKEATFNQLYGGINKKYLHIEFFKRAKDFATKLYKDYENDGYVVSIVSGRKLFAEDMNTAKLFNYYIQMLETELNVVFLHNLFKELDFQKCLPILYTYDAILFDSKQGYIDELLQKINTNLTAKFPITVKIGDNYKEMSSI